MQLQMAMNKMNKKDIREREKENSSFVPVLVPPFPVNMLVELTNACNNRCIFCANRDMTRKIRHIDEGLLYRLLREAYSNGTREVGFYTIGEPFLSDNLADYVAEARKIGFTYIYISTNGILATPQRIMAVVDAGLDSIKFSINAATQENYHKIHGTDNFHKVYNNLKFLWEYRKKIGKRLCIYVSFILTQQNQHEFEQFRDLFGSLADNIYFYEVDDRHGIINDDIRVKKQDYAVWSCKLTIPCSMVFNRIHVTCEGYLTACCADYQNYLAVADLNTHSLKDAWQDEVFLDLRKRHLENKLQGVLCYNCLYGKKAKIKPLLPQCASV